MPHFGSLGTSALAFCSTVDSARQAKPVFGSAPFEGASVELLGPRPTGGTVHAPPGAAAITPRARGFHGAATGAHAFHVGALQYVRQVQDGERVMVIAADIALKSTEW
ncbi:hypothetical protein B7P34_25585 [Streptosporangium nondiastaticum]|uniref:Uncharacterized protein n=1 Tax=Streptosporangium nondiastaticum TaxID=35764 RepID=A0A9X7JLG6_9ACTN|nr:hypothetical protein B7P34_25585 [Streptosporangium nondiastaticum]